MRMFIKMLSLNNAGWGKRPESSSQNQPGTPPTEPSSHTPEAKKNETVADFSKKFKDFLKNSSGKGSGGAGGGSESKLPKRIPFILGGVFATYWLYTGVYTVSEGQVAVITQFGRYHSQVASAGFYWHLPNPIQDHVLVDAHKVRTIVTGTVPKQNSDGKENLVLTKGENIVNINFEVNYRINLHPTPEGQPSHIQNFLFENFNPEDVVRDAAESIVQEVVGRHEMQSIISSNRGEIAQQVKKDLQALMEKYRVGVEITEVSIRAHPPQKVIAAFNDTLIAEQDRARLKDVGDEYKRNLVRKATSDARNMLTDAEGYKESVVQKAQGESARFLALLPEYRSAPQVTRDRLYIETLQEIYARTNKVYVDANKSNPSLYMPFSGQPMRPLENSSTVNGNQTPSTNQSPAVPGNTDNSAKQPQSTVPGAPAGAASSAQAPASVPTAPTTGSSFWSGNGNLWTR